MASIQKFLVRLLNGVGFQEITATTSGGPSYAGQIPALDGTTGLLNINMMPTGIGPEIDNTGICGTTSLTAGMYINFYDDAGTKKVRPADKTDNTKPAHGFILGGFTAGQTVTVYLANQRNTAIPLGSFVAADAGKPLYLSTNGAVVLTRPTVTGNLEHVVGIVENIGTTVTSSFLPQTPITIA